MREKTTQTLSAPELASIEEAWLACRLGSLPIGAAVTNGKGEIISRGHNLRLSRQEGLHPLAGSAMAHAEILALGSIKHNAPLQNFTLYSTTEPCPMCTGAVRMAGIGRVRYLSRDPFAGSMPTEDTPATQRPSCAVQGPTSVILENLLIALLVERLIHVSQGNMLAAVNSWTQVAAQGVAFGKWLNTEQTIVQMCSVNVSATEMLTSLELLYQKHFAS